MTAYGVETGTGTSNDGPVVPLPASAFGAHRMCEASPVSGLRHRYDRTGCCAARVSSALVSVTPCPEGKKVVIAVAAGRIGSACQVAPVSPPWMPKSKLNRSAPAPSSSAASCSCAQANRYFFESSDASYDVSAPSLHHNRGCVGVGAVFCLEKAVMVDRTSCTRCVSSPCTPLPKSQWNV